MTLWQSGIGCSRVQARAVVRGLCFPGTAPPAVLSLAEARGMERQAALFLSVHAFRRGRPFAEGRAPLSAPSRRFFTPGPFFRGRTEAFWPPDPAGFRPPSSGPTSSPDRGGPP